MASVQANRITIEYEERSAHGGDGEPLMLVMGLGGQLTDWPQGLIDELTSRGFRVIMFDNRDSGLSTECGSVPPSKGELARAVVLRRKLRSEYLIADLAADAVGLLDALSIEQAHVVGMSMGGMIAQQVAITCPQRVLSLTSIMSTTGDQRVGRPLFRIVRNALRRPTPSRADAVQVAIETFRELCGPTFDEADFRALAERAVARSYRPEGTARQMGAIIASPDRTPALQRLRVPALVIHGLLDPLVRLSGGVATAKAIPGARLVLFNDMAHDLPRTRWREMADEIRAIANRAPAATPART